MSAARGSAGSNRPEKGSPARRRPSSGSEDRVSIPQKKDAEAFGEFLHGGKSVASPIVRSFEEDILLKRPPPDFVLGQEHWLGLREEIREKIWQMYRLVNPTTIAEAEKSSRTVEAISRARNELAEKKAREVFEDEHEQKRSDLQSRLEEAACRTWDHDRIQQNTEGRIAGVEALVKELKAEAATASRDQRETYDQNHRLCREWRKEETKSKREFGATFHQDWVRQPLKLPDLPSSVLPFKDSKLAQPQRSEAPPPTNAEASRTEVSAWVGFTSDRRPAQEARWTPQPRGLRAKFTDHSKTLGRWKFLSLRELEAEQMEPPAQRAIAELGCVLDSDLSWRSSFPGLVDIKTAMLRELWDHMGSFSQELHQAVWDTLQSLARATPGKRQEGRSDWKRYHDRSPPRKFSARGETNAEQLINENMALVDLEDRSCSNRASVIDPTQELRADRPISSNPNVKLDKEMEMKYRQLPTKKLRKIRPALPLQEYDEGRGFVEFMMSLDQTLQDILSLDPRSTSQALSWAPGWHVPLAQKMSLGLGESEIVPILLSQCDVEFVHGTGRRSYGRW